MSQIMKTTFSFFTAFTMLIGTGGFADNVTPAANTETGNRIIRIPCGMANCYLIAGEEQSVLVDTGGSKNQKKVFDIVKDYNVTLIVLTHGHYDHIQNAAYLADKLNAKVAMSADDYDLIKKPSAHKTEGRTLLQKLFSASSALFYPFLKVEPFEPDFFLTGGQSLDEFGVDGTIVELKGHTKGSIGFLLNDSKDLFVGDAFMNIFNISEPFLFEDYEELKVSEKIIKNSCGKMIYPGHGTAFSF